MLGQIVRRYCVRIAVRRGIIAYARSLAREKIEAEREAERRARSLLPHAVSERMVAPPSIDELGVFSVSHVPGVLWTEEEDAGH